MSNLLGLTFTEWFVVPVGVLILLTTIFTTVYVFFTPMWVRKNQRKFDEESIKILESRLFDEALEVYKTLFKGHNPNAPAQKFICTLCVSMSLKEEHGNEERSVISLANEILLGIRNNSFPDSDCVEVKETDDGIELKAGLYSVTKKYNQYSNSLGSGARIVVYPKPRYKKS